MKHASKIQLLVGLLALGLGVTGCTGEAPGGIAPQAGPQPQGPASAASIRVASWNLSEFSHLRSSRAVDKVTRIIWESEFDVVALQEIRDPAAVTRLQDSLKERTGYDWLSFISERTRRLGPDEHLAFIWNATKVRALSPAGITIDDPQDKLAHSPFVAAFRAGEFDFVLVNIHLPRYGRSRTQDILRARQLEMLNDLYFTVREASQDEKDIVLLGDFGADPQHDGWTLHAFDYRPLFSSDRHQSDVRGRGLSDNIWIHPGYTTEYAGGAKIEAFDENDPDYRQFSGSVDADPAAREISAHRPVSALFNTGLPAGDDDVANYGVLTELNPQARKIALTRAPTRHPPGRPPIHTKPVPEPR
ncbi:MAG: endonuclease/exonuclease/phosphatase family protein [Bacteriovoracia bacterium]